MSYVTLALLKKHVMADDYVADDVYLQHLLDAAEGSVVGMTNRPVSELLVPGSTPGTSTLPAQLQHAVLLLAGHWYNQREAVSNAQMAEVPLGIQTLVKPYRRLVDDSGTDED